MRADRRVVHDKGVADRCEWLDCHPGTDARVGLDTTIRADRAVITDQHRSGDHRIGSDRRPLADPDGTIYCSMPARGALPYYRNIPKQALV